MDPYSLPESIKQLLYLPTTGPGYRESQCIICRDEILYNQPSATHQCCGTTLCKKCFLGYILQKTWDNRASSLAPDCPYCKRPILRPHPYAPNEIVMVATTIDLVHRCVGDLVFYSKPLNLRQQGDLLSDEQAMMMLDPQGRHPRAQQQYEEMKAHRAAGWRVYCFEEANPSTFLVAEGRKSVEQSTTDQSYIHPVFRQPTVQERHVQPRPCRKTDDKDTRNSEHADTSGEAVPEDAAEPSRIKRLWRAATEPVRGGLNPDAWRLAFACGD